MSDRVLAALEELSAAFPRDGITAATYRVYIKALAQFPEPAVLAAIEQAKLTRTFWPSISELTDIMAQHANGPDDLAETAWTEVQREIRRVGYQPYRVFRNGQFHDPPKPTFSTPRIAEAVESMGWREICTGDTAEVRERFLWTYKSLRKRDTAKIQRGDFGTDPALPGVRQLGEPA
jgi:hypothetical protein